MEKLYYEQPQIEVVEIAVGCSKDETIPVTGKYTVTGFRFKP